MNNLEFWKEVKQDFDCNVTQASSYLCDNSQTFFRQWRTDNHLIKQYALSFLDAHLQYKDTCFVSDGLLFVCTLRKVPQEWRYEIRNTFLRWIINQLGNDNTGN